jgi:hypothetical protein
VEKLRVGQLRVIDNASTVTCADESFNSFAQQPATQLLVAAHARHPP